MFRFFKYFICFLLFTENTLAQIEPMYSQYMFNMLNINPAYAGMRATPSFVALFRNQWLGLPGAPRTGNISFDMPFESHNSAIGAQFFSDVIGVQKNNGVKINYAYRTQLSETNILGLGINLGFKNRRANYNDVNTINPGDPAFNYNISTFNIDAGAGFFFATDNFYIGGSIPFILKSNITTNDPLESDAKWLESVRGRDLSIFLTTGYAVNLNRQLVLKPSLMLKRSGSSFQADLNANLWVNDIISFGFSYRTKESVVGMLEWQMTPNLRFGYSYDRSINILRLYNSGSHEVMLRIALGSKYNDDLISKYF